MCLYHFSHSEVGLSIIMFVSSDFAWDSDPVKLGSSEFLIDATAGELRQVGGALTEAATSVRSCSSFSLSKEII